VSDSVTITTLILAAIPTTIASIAAAMMAYLAFKKSATTAILSEKTAEISSKTNHLVNGGMLLQLKLHAKTSRLLASAVPNPVNEAVAVLAEKELQEHLDKKNLIEGAIDR
jgi:hypothetical protein